MRLPVTRRMASPPHDEPSRTCDHAPDDESDRDPLDQLDGDVQGDASEQDRRAGPEESRRPLRRGWLVAHAASPPDAYS